MIFEVCLFPILLPFIPHCVRSFPSKDIRLTAKEFKEISPHLESLIKDKVVSLERLEWLTKAVVSTIDNVLIHHFKVPPRQVEATVSTKDMVSDVFVARHLFLLPKQFIVFLVIKPNVLISCDEPFL